jgi:3D (Asp-Asp-Asp) domain-containing protein
MALCALSQAQTRHHRLPRAFAATAYAQGRTTASGLPVREGLVAADPKVLPMGTRIQVSNAGPYSGTYTVADTGAAVRGRHIDIYMHSLRRAKRFGRRRVLVTVLRWGDWQAPHS